jgi:hypothetical protein
MQNLNDFDREVQLLLDMIGGEPLAKSGFESVTKSRFGHCINSLNLRLIRPSGGKIRERGLRYGESQLPFARFCFEVGITENMLGLRAIPKLKKSASSAEE